MLHFATHAYIDPIRPEYCAIVLSLADEQGNRLNSTFTLEQIYQLSLQPGSLVVLSACDTGLGKVTNGEGLVGLAQGFFSAGANQVISSLWQVTDASTTELMQTFYRSLIKQKLPSSTALQKAQLKLYQKNFPPYYWAAFTLEGDSQIKQNVKPIKGIRGIKSIKNKPSIAK